jgi:hypothetical protein
MVKELQPYGPRWLLLAHQIESLARHTRHHYSATQEFHGRKEKTLVMSVKLSSSSWLCNITLNLGMFTSLPLGTRCNHALIIGTFFIDVNGKNLADFVLTNFVSANGMVFFPTNEKMGIVCFY